MAGFSFTDQPLDNNLVASVACLLDSAGVPNHLWGNYLLTVYGVPTIVDGAAFVVPDTLMNTAFSALLNAGFIPCTQNSNCPHSNASRCPPPAAHLHIDDELAISLHQESSVFWEFPSFGLHSFGIGNPDIMLASDSRLPSARLGHGQGRFSPTLYPVRIPTAIRYCESIILLLCRDRGSNYEMYWIAIMTYLLEFVDGTDIFDEEGIGQCYKHFYHALKHGDPKMFSFLDELRNDLGKRQVLPATCDIYV